MFVFGIAAPLLPVDEAESAVDRQSSAVIVDAVDLNDAVSSDEDSEWHCHADVPDASVDDLVDLQIAGEAAEDVRVLAASCRALRRAT